MSIDDDMFEEYLQQLADRYTASELVEEMDLSIWDVIEMFRDKLEEGYVQLDDEDN